jgi:hypothetical protein
MDTNLPAVPDPSRADADERAPATVERPWTVALLPLGLVVFIILALVITAWTFLSAAV